jgi:hypothetical protein
MVSCDSARFWSSSAWFTGAGPLQGCKKHRDVDKVLQHVMDVAAHRVDLPEEKPGCMDGEGRGQHKNKKCLLYCKNDFLLLSCGIIKKCNSVLIKHF